MSVHPPIAAAKRTWWHFSFVPIARITRNVSLAQKYARPDPVPAHGEPDPKRGIISAPADISPWSSGRQLLPPEWWRAAGNNPRDPCSPLGLFTSNRYIGWILRPSMRTLPLPMSLSSVGSSFIFATIRLAVRMAAERLDGAQIVEHGRVDPDHGMQLGMRPRAAKYPRRMRGWRRSDPSTRGR